MATITYREIDAIEVTERDRRLGWKVNVYLPAPFETVKFGKIVHVRAIRRKPILRDGRVVVKFGADYREIKAELITIDGREFRCPRFVMV